MHDAERRQHIGGRKDGWNFKKGQNVSLTFPKHFGASNCKKERDNEGERQKGGGTRGEMMK